jgi:hypothetical protein
MRQLSDSPLVFFTAACQRPDRRVFPITAKPARLARQIAIPVWSNNQQARGGVAHDRGALEELHQTSLRPFDTLCHKKSESGQT